MKPITVLAFALVLGAGLLSFVAMRAPSAGEPPAGSTARPGTELPTAADLERLRAALDELTQRVERLELAPPTPVLSAAPQRQSADAVTSAELDEIRAMVAAIKDPSAATGVPFESMVLDVIENRERLEEAERDQRRADAAAERIEQRVAELAEELGLSSFQSGEMLSILTREDAERSAFFDTMRAEGTFDRGAMREGMEALRAATEEAVGEVLSPDQFERYQETARPPFGGGGGGRGDRPRGGDGGGNGGGGGGRG